MLRDIIVIQCVDRPLHAGRWLCHQLSSYFKMFLFRAGSENLYFMFSQHLMLLLERKYAGRTGPRVTYLKEKSHLFQELTVAKLVKTLHVSYGT
jgi:hypothetical protein